MAQGHRGVLHTIRGVLIITPWLLHLLGADLLLSLLLPVALLAPTTAYNLSSRIAFSVWYVVQTIFTTLNGAQVTVSGDVLPRKESAIVVANHVAWSDFYLIQHLALQAGMLSRCRWFAKQQLRWVPFLGWGLWAMGMPLISRRWDKDRKELDRVFRGPKLYKWPIWLISYSEATRYTAQKYLETVQWCKAHDKPIPRHVLFPRTKGFVTTLKELRKDSSVGAVYDLTLAYAHQGRFLETPTIWQTLSVSNLGRDWRFHIHVERFDIADLAAKSDAELASWLENRWMIKSERLESLKQDLHAGRSWTNDSGSDLEKRERRNHSQRR